jgi:hypothetical protein
MMDDYSGKNRRRGKGKIKITRRQKVDNKELTKELLSFKETIFRDINARDEKIKDLKEELKAELKKKTEEGKKNAIRINKKIEILQDQECPGQASERLGEIFLDLVENYATKSSFSGYTFLEEMKSRAIFFLLKYSAKSFNPEKSKNAFAYCTQIVKNAFIQVIKKEKKRAEAKKEYIENYFRSHDLSKKPENII